MNTMTTLPEEEIRQAIKRRYAKLATSTNGSCCSAEITVDDVPNEALTSAASCGTPVTHAALQRGDVVVDLGSGAGIDVFRASKLVGETGKVIGVDSTPEMLFKARELAKEHGYTNVEFRLGEIEHLPVESSSVDVVLSNCVLNLVPDKEVAFKEIYRVLKRGGRISVSDMVSSSDQVKDQLRHLGPEEWASCIAGAITVNEYRDLLEKAGFQGISYLDETPTSNETCYSKESPVKSVSWLAAKPQ
jgi:SAM-dependent methyltransferase